MISCVSIGLQQSTAWSRKCNPEGPVRKTSIRIYARPFMSRLRVTSILALAFVSVAIVFAQQPPKELVDYIRDARKAGLKDAQIQQNALGVGWPADAVTGALESGRKAPAETPAASGTPGV